MKLRRLLLKAFGPFTDRRLDFTTPGVDLHLIYGANEAGKSSALRAMGDLRFGIPLRSADDFIHPTAELRIAGLFTTPEGGELGLVRRKGRGTTLLHCDAEGEPHQPTMAATEDELQALTGGLRREEFELMFGLDHSRLRQGGEGLLRGEGELGAALFEASSGTRGIETLRAAIEADSKELFNPHGGAKKATINSARQQLEEAQRELREAQVRPADWQLLERAQRLAQEQLGEAEERLEALRREESGLTELRAVAPLLQDYDGIVLALADLAHLPSLPPDAPAQRSHAQQELESAQRRQQEAAEVAQGCARALATLPLEPQLIAHAEAIERLVAAGEGASQGQVTVDQLDQELEQYWAELTQEGQRIAPQQPLANLLAALPSRADRVNLQHHLSELDRLQGRIQTHREHLTEQELQLQQEDGARPSLPPASARKALADALQRARALGDTAQQRKELATQQAELHRQLQQALSDLGVADEAALRRAQPLLEAEIDHARQTQQQLMDQQRSLTEEGQRLHHDRRQLEQRLRALAAAGEVVTAATLHEARQRRDQGWGLVRQIYIEGQPTAERLDPRRPLPEAFEAAQSEADRQADLLRADTERATSYAEHTGRIAEIGDRQQEIGTLLAQTTQQQGQQQAAWTQRLRHHQLPPLAPEPLREWQRGRHSALLLADQLATGLREQELLHTTTTERAAALVEALAQLGHPSAPASPLPFSSLLEAAAELERQLTNQEAEASARQKNLLTRRQEQERRRQGLRQDEASEQAQQQHVKAWHQRLFLPDTASAAMVEARLEELTALVRRHEEFTTARARRDREQVVIRRFNHDAQQLAALLGEPPPPLPAPFAEQLRRRLANARKAAEQQQRLQGEQEGAQTQLRQAAAQIDQQRTRLDQLCRNAGAAQLAELPALEAQVQHKRTLEGRLAELRQQLARVSQRPEEALRTALAGSDSATLETARDRCRAAIEQQRGVVATARTAEQAAARQLEAIDSSDRAAMAREAVESAAARIQAALFPWARLRLAHALLEEALRRFRERAQAPMVAAASDYFRLITGGRYHRLATEEENGQPVLRAERQEGGWIGVAAMSEGSADQLYLALRLAALELRRDSHPFLPLVLDDVLITSDDRRAGHILQALSRFAQGGQVLLFTHHAHLIEVARSALGEEGFALHEL